ncbi:MAG TPA: hypothetical protein VGI10_22625 [Polyangiaceae bacterium]
MLALASIELAFSFACGGRASRDRSAPPTASAGSAGLGGTPSGGNPSGGTPSGGAPSGGSSGIGGTTAAPCLNDADCPTSRVCETCADGSAVCPVSQCVSGTCVDLTPICNCKPAQIDGGTSSTAFRCNWVDCTGITCPSGTSCQCCGGFSRGCLCTTPCMIDAECTDPTRPVCDQGVCSDGAFLCCGCP